MIWPFRRPQTAPDASDRHQTVLDLIEQVTALRGQVRSMELEWTDVRDQIKKAYQRMEKANERAEKREAKKVEGWDDDVEDPAEEVREYATSFEKKLAAFKKG